MTSMSSGSHSSFNSDEESSEEEKISEQLLADKTYSSGVSSVLIADNRDNKSSIEESSEPAKFVLRKMKSKRDLSLKEKSTLSRVVTALVGDRVVL